MGDERKLFDMMPLNTPRYMADAWLGCLAWAISERDILARFMAETGVRPASSPIARMIDAATGHGDAIPEAFIAWFNANVWGDPFEIEAEATA